MSKDQKSVATVRLPSIEAVLNELYRFSEKSHAVERMENIRKHFITSKEQPTGGDPEIKLWIKGFALTEDEKKAGYNGNYATICVRQMKDGKYTLCAKKLVVDLKQHPQRRRPKLRHPDWGHPIMRSIRKKTVYKSLEVVQAVMQALHEEFPDVSIPCTNKMYIMIYGKEENGKSSVKKIVLTVEAHKEGGFYLAWKENTYQRKSGQKKADKNAVPMEEKVMAIASATAAAGGGRPASGGEAGGDKGYFTSMVELRASKKKKK